MAAPGSAAMLAVDGTIAKAQVNFLPRAITGPMSVIRTAAADSISMAKLLAPESAPASDLQPSPDLLSAQTRNVDHFIAAALAGGYGNGGTRHFQNLGQEIDAGPVCPAL
jgi:hypothetical protein